MAGLASNDSGTIGRVSNHGQVTTKWAVAPPEAIDAAPTKGRKSDRLYRRVRLEGEGFDGIVRYDPRLEDLIEDVPLYIAHKLNARAWSTSVGTTKGAMYRVLDIPLPGHG